MVLNSSVPGLSPPQDMQLVEGSICEHWFQDDGVSRIHIFIDSAAQGERQQIMFQRPCAGKMIIFCVLNLQVPRVFVVPVQFWPS